MVRATNNVSAKPLELGAKLLCRWRNDEWKPCEVIERKERLNDDLTHTGDWDYCAPIILNTPKQTSNDIDIHRCL